MGGLPFRAARGSYDARKLIENGIVCAAQVQVLFGTEHVGSGVVLDEGLLTRRVNSRMLASRSRIDLSLYFQPFRLVFPRRFVT